VLASFMLSLVIAGAMFAVFLAMGTIPFIRCEKSRRRRN
jgi:hypothetical protein